MGSAIAGIKKEKKDGQVMKENDNILLTEKPGNLMKKYSVPCIISLLVAALYNIVGKLPNHRKNSRFGKNGEKIWLEEKKKRSYCNRF